MSTSEQRVGKRSEQKRRWDRENSHRKYDKCGCGARKTKKSDLCAGCVRARVEGHRRRIVELWACGYLMREIAVDLGWGFDHLKAEFGRMRRYGYDLPHRYGKRAA